ncbi:MAG: DUF3515 domain-containing protein [Nocardioidaceae bacterium]|nr:DUF3515 domain-containing protein [Nocardioidaceae bacterium]NUS52003.1 DUF3515 domain-containing protein [Nocardioidaceae bacterium]
MGAVVCLLLVASCSSTVGIDAPEVSGADARTCRRLVDALPGKVADQPRRTSDDGAGYGAAWGDPPIVLRCGTGRGEGFNAFAKCQVANGVAWYVPESQIQGRPVDVTMTTVGRSVNVEVDLPEDYFPPAAAMVDLAPAIKRTVPDVKPCL